MEFAAYLEWLIASAGTVGSPKKSPRAAPPHPGTVLEAEYLAPQAMSQSELARRAGTTPAKVNEIVNGRRGVSVAFALALEAVLGTPASLWLSLQAEFDLDQARREAPRKKRRKVSSSSRSPSSRRRPK